eukprot:TRINITY_DN4433_c0_g2_i4.p1 TRINITY_DN4433_c0_g2~~TRINITY_DN4433_c0_g2_i4.p1  ORF type:complete len:598 (+),score=159.56 TRINITY_DN4433_c0_g2_i4:17-1810(+)
MPPKRQSDQSSSEGTRVEVRKPQILVDGNKYEELFVKNKDNSETLELLSQEVIDKENEYRELFAQKRDDEELDDHHLMLISAFDCPKEFFDVHKPDTATPQVFPISPEKKVIGRSIVSEKEFKQNFNLFTEYQLDRNFDWNNVFIAGGSVLAALQPVPELHGKNNQTKRNFYHKLAYLNSDIDLFIYGLNEQEANKKLEQIFESISENVPADVLCFRSEHAVTIISQFPYRHIQVILRLYKSPAEILMGFDVDACSVGFDGDKVWMTPRAHKALITQSNTVDMTRRSPTYEQRLAKYSERGFAVNVPSLDRMKIDPQLFERRFDQLQGLARLLLFEKLNTPEARTTYKLQQRMRKLRPKAERKSTIFDEMKSEYGNDDYTKERLRDSGGDASDYSTVFLPWGPKWHAERIRKLMYTKDMVLNSPYYDPNKKYHTHPCFFGTASEVIKDCCGKCPPVPEDEIDPDSPYVSGEMQWLKVNPGAQNRIGSFHPITEGDWTEGAYINPKAQHLFYAINTDDLSSVKKCYEHEKIDLNGRDPVGRTPLQMAAFSNSIKSAEYLISAGAKISAKMADGRTALHIASSYGHHAVSYTHLTLPTT